MASTVITFSAPLNVSCQIGDTAYYLNGNATSGGFTTGIHSDIIEIGVVTAIGGTAENPTITVGNSLVVTFSTSFILFSKNNKANLSSALGYYAEIKFKNSSTITSELFSVGVDMFESSK